MTRPCPAREAAASLQRRSLLLATAASVFAPSLALAQAAPSSFRPRRPVRIISPLQAGGAVDALTRPIAQALSEYWGVGVVVENRPGGGNIVATSAISQAMPDGHTFGVASSALTINPSLRNDLPYDTFRDLTPLSRIGNLSNVIVANPDFPPNNLTELIAYAKAHPNEISYASPGIGTSSHITAELLKVRTRINMTHIPFPGSNGAYQELVPGRVQIAFVGMESTFSYVAAGKIKVLALTDVKRNRFQPQYPVLEETFPGLGFDTMLGFIGPRNLPAPIVAGLNEAITAVLRDPAIRQKLQQQAVEAMPCTPAEYATAIREDIEHWKGAVKESGAKVS